MDPSRHLADFEPTLWGDHFLSYTPQQTEISSQEKVEVDELKVMIRKTLVETPDNSTQKLVLIDRIQRLGVAYHFHNEIEISIKNIFDSQLQSETNDDNLHVVALRFRLLRQQRHYISSDVFKQFMDHNGNFKETLINYDVQGLLSLYEASHMRMHDEEILEEALIFTTTRLESLLPNLTNNSLKIQVTEALSQPIHETVPRVGARKYIHIYENIKSHNDLLLKFAKLDFNMLQKVHQDELNEISRWWKDLDIANKLPYAKDRFVESYFWIIGLSVEPQYSRLRRMLTKVVNMNSIVDDTYDAYGTHDELVFLTNAIERWDISVMDSLPPYMRIIYQELLNIYDEAEEVLAKEGKSNSVIYYAKNEWKKLTAAYMKESDWLNAGYIPKCDEYMKNAVITATCMLYVTNSLVGMDKLYMTKENIEWLTNGLLVARSAGAICRCMDDISDHEVNQQRGHVASIVDCYIKEYEVSKEEAHVEIRKMVTNAWKDINKEFLFHKDVPFFVLELGLNFAQLVDTTFGDGHDEFRLHDEYTSPKSETKKMLSLLLVESINI
ncbi:germacrene C synthase-like [Solanum tuberosum]|uniref:germacrene C synthase-like n=1 Tax=Solanum tuberosum TaxID=4113 RepID=UPI00073A0DCE|nr:PREDICTED: germacrene C synthase-like [Solanum tuberosum]